MTIFTAFCQEADGSGTIWISTVEADDVLAAVAMAQEACAADWDYDPDDIHVLGIARGDVEICHWEDICDREC